MEDEAPPRPSVAELAGRFRGSAPQSAPPRTEAEKPVRRRPPRTLALPPRDPEPPPAAGGPPIKRNSALIEKLQANLALSPTAPPLKSPGPRQSPVAMATPASPTGPAHAEEEGPASFEAPPTAKDGNLLSSFNKGRARLSIRRRPPSRRHRKSSSEEGGGGEEERGEEEE
ncbi:duboraya, partial [Menidia menidia]